MDNSEKINNNSVAPIPEFGSEEWISMKQNEMSAHAAELARQEAEKARSIEVREPEVNVDLRSEHEKENDNQDDEETVGEVTDDSEMVDESAITEQATAPADENAEDAETAEVESDGNEDVAENSHEAEVDDISVEERLKNLDAKFDDLQKNMVEQMETLTNQIDRMNQQMHDGLRMFDMLANQYSDSLETEQDDEFDDMADAYIELPKLKNDDVVDTYAEMLDEEKSQEV